MDVFGWILFAVGALLLALFALIGIDTGGTAVANLAGTLVGAAMMISGAVFAAGSRIEQALRADEGQIASERPALKTPKVRTEEEKQKEEDKTNTQSVVSIVLTGIGFAGTLLAVAFLFGG